MKKYQINLVEKKIIKDQGLLQFEEIKKQILILPELEELIPPLLTDELQQLEQNIIREGCREALLVWQTTEETIYPEKKDTNTVYVLIDGHNRYSICTKHGIDFKIHLVDFKNLYDARQYMVDNQLGRRNLTPEQVSYLRGMKYLTEKKEKGKYERLDHKGQNVLYGSETSEINPTTEGNEHKGQTILYGTEMVSTSEKLGKRFNVSEKTIKRDAEFASGLEKLDSALKLEILSGQIKVSKTLIQQVGKTDVTDLPLTTVDQIEQAIKEPIETKKVIVKPIEEVLEVQKEVLIRQLAELTKELQQTGAVSICDEIILCASKIKKIKK
jgi:hypothetical protein